MHTTAPEWDVTQWFNTPNPIALADLRGRVVVVLAFQMLCPGCVSRAIPQMLAVRQTFAPDDVAVIGLHTVFEHHDGMGPASLKAFLHEYRVTFPVGIDRADPAGGSMPVTMARYAMGGTPTVLVIDREGLLIEQAFGHLSDLRLGTSVAGALMANGKLGTASIDVEDVMCRAS